MIRFQFVEDHRDTHAVKRMCTVLGLNRSSYYKWRETRHAREERQQRDGVLLEHIRATTRNRTGRWDIGASPLNWRPTRKSTRILWLASR